MNEIQSEILIDASKETVWEILTDFESYENWNPFIIKITGKAEPDATIQFVARMNGIDLPIVARILSFEKNKRLSWGGPDNRLIKQMIGAEHYYIIEEINAKCCRFINGEKMSGLIPGVLWPVIKNLKPAYEAMNQSLKLQAEQRKK